MFTFDILFTLFLHFQRHNKNCETCWHTCFRFCITLNLAIAFSNGEKTHLTGNKYIFDGNLERKLLCGKKLNRKYITPTNWKLDITNALFTIDEKMHQYLEF